MSVPVSHERSGEDALTVGGEVATPGSASQNPLRLRRGGGGHAREGNRGAVNGMESGTVTCRTGRNSTGYADGAV